MEFPMATIEHCDREANQVAHELAQQAFVSKAICIWVDSPPSFIFPILSNDVTMLADEWKLAWRHLKKRNYSHKNHRPSFLPWFCINFHALLHFPEILFLLYFSSSKYFGRQFRPSLAVIIVDGMHYRYMQCHPSSGYFHASMENEKMLRTWNSMRKWNYICPSLLANYFSIFFPKNMLSD